MQQNIQNLIESLSPNERAIIPYLKEKTLEDINKKTDLDKTTILRALEFLSNKQILELKTKQEKINSRCKQCIKILKKGIARKKINKLNFSKKYH